MRGKIAEHLGALRERAAGLRVREERERGEAGERALLLEGPSGGNLLRYERMHELAFHRAYGAFLKGRQEAAETGGVPGAPSEAIVGALRDAIRADGGGLVAGRGPEAAPPEPPRAGPEGAVSGWPRTLAGSLAPNEAKAPAPVVASDQLGTITVSQGGGVAAEGRDASATL